MHLKKDGDTGQVTEVFVPHFDTHVHARRRPMMDTILPEAALRMCGGTFEPNTLEKNVGPHLETYRDVLAYLSDADQIASQRRWSASIYLTSKTSPKEVLRAWDEGLIAHVKRYPPHGTTNSGEAVTLEMILDKNSSTYALLREMSDADVPLKNHGEVTEWNGKHIPPGKREAIYYNEVQPRIMDLYPNLRQIGAHLSGMAAVEHYREFGDRDTYVCEFTSHHPMFDDTIRYQGGFLLPDHHCLPVVQGEEHRAALRDLLKEAPPYLMAGSDMAAHDTRKKYAHKVFGGFYTYHCSLELYIQLLDELDMLSYAEAFLYGNAKRFHGKLVPDNPPSFHLVRNRWFVESRVKYEGGEMTPFGFDENPLELYEFQWKLVA
jgi:dihydroorotase